jgi:hypothetical protein
MEIGAKRVNNDRQLGTWMDVGVSQVDCVDPIMGGESFSPNTLFRFAAGLCRPTIQVKPFTAVVHINHAKSVPV